ncbi:MAG: hypothetical protein WC553_02230 [Patescibacteria group bacterium]
MGDPITAILLACGIAMLIISGIAYHICKYLSDMPVWVMGFGRLGVLFILSTPFFYLMALLVVLMGKWEPTAIVGLVLSPMVLFGPPLCAIGIMAWLRPGFWDPLWRWLSGINEISTGKSYQRFIHH